MRTLLALMVAVAVAPVHLVTWTGEPPMTADTAAAVQKAQAGDFSALIKRADAGNADAELRLGQAYMSGAKGLPRDAVKACAYEEKASPKRADAMHLAGMCH